MKCYPEIKEKEEMRKIIGRYGLSGKQQVSGGRGPEPWEAETAPLPFALGCSAVELTGLKEGAAVAARLRHSLAYRQRGSRYLKTRGLDS